MELRKPSLLRPSQLRCIEHQLCNPYSMTWLRMGKGKTVATLTTIAERINRLEVYGTLIVGPLRVIQTVWQKEASLWEHTRHLTFSMCHHQSQAEKIRSIMPGKNIYLINYDSLHKFCDMIIHLYLSQGQYPPFNSIVYDEITMVKNHMSRRSKSIQRILPYLQYRMGLTGTPSPNGYKDLFGQYYVLDNGARLGDTKKKFESAYFKKSEYDIEELPNSRALIKGKIADITYMVGAEDEAEDDSPPFVFNPIEIILPKKIMDSYNELEDKMFLQLESGTAIEALNTAALYNKCLQASNGALYFERDNPNYEILHDSKLDALTEIIEETNGSVLVMYSFIHDFKRIKEKFPHAEFFHSGMSRDQAVDLEDRWNRGKVPLLIGHPKSMGHGLNLQFGGSNIVWYGLNWSLELFEQAIYRLRRPGQQFSVFVHMLMCQGTLDYAVYAALERKAKTQDELRDTINDYRKGKINTGVINVDNF